MHDNEEPLIYAEDKPLVQELIDDFKACSPWSDNDWNRITDNENVRFTRWPGQAPDGKKHNTTQKKAFPFDGASDTRIPLADSVINENVAICANAFWRAMLRPKVGTSEGSDYAVKLADYYLNTVLYDEIFREVELSEQYRQMMGWVVLHPRWCREISMYRREVTMAQLVAAAGEIQDPNSPMAHLPEMIKDPTFDESTAELLKQLYAAYAATQVEQYLEVELPDLPKKTLLRAIKELRLDGKTELPLPCVAKNQPEILALKPYDEIFLPPSCTDVQTASRIYRRTWITEWEARAKIMTDKWDPEWVEEAAKHKGKYSTWSINPPATPPPMQIVDALMTVPQNWTYTQQGEKLIEVIYSFYRALDSDNVPGVYCTVFHPMVCKSANSRRELYAEHYLLECPRGQQPFVSGQRENWNRCIAQARGVPQIVSTWQREIKVQRDALVDHTSIGVTPPVLIPKGAMNAEMKFGPASQNEVTPGREPRFMEIPQGGTPLALELIQVVNTDTDHYFGRLAAEVPPARVQAKQQMLVQPFLLMWSRALQQMLCLAQCYMPDAEFARVTGAPQGWLEQRRAAYGVLDVELQFDVRELDPDYVMGQLDVINKTVIPGDVAGVIDRAKYTKLQLRAISPMLAKELVADQQAASQMIFRQVQNDIALMFLGNEPEYVEMDPTAQTKLQFASQIVGTNPNYQQALQQGGRFKDLMEKYVMNLQFSITQEQNKQVGTLGVKPEAPALQQ